MSPRLTFAWVAIALALIALTLYCINLVESGQFSLAGVVVGIVVGFMVVGLVILGNFVRASALRKSYPYAFVSNIGIYPEGQAQLRALTAALGLDFSAIRGRRSASLVLDHATLRLFAGSRAPKQILEVPSSEISAMGISKVPQGKWMLNCLEIGFEHPGGGVVVDFCLMGSGFSFPHVVGGKALDRQFAHATAARQRTPS